MLFCAAVDAATYSASVEDKVTMNCLADHHEMGLPERMKTNSEVDFCVERLLL
jgi:hypothetical protein